MDSLTHIVFGAAIGEVMLGKKIGKKGMLWGAIANSLPDIDVLANFFTDPVNALLIHRGFTHSIFFAVVISPFLAWLLHKRHIHSSASFIYWMLFFMVAIIAHDVIDVFTAYGTGLLEPFSHQRFSTNSIFVADPFYTLPLLISFIILLILKQNSDKRKLINYSGIAISTIYMTFTFINKINIDTIVKQNLKEEKISYTTFMSTPSPLNNFLWYIIIKTDSGFYTGYYSIFDSDKKILLRYTPKNEFLISDISSDKKIEKLKFFANGYYCITSINKEIYFNDMRFGPAAGWAKQDSRFVFSYNLQNEIENVVVLRRTDFEISWKEALKSLVKRIKGN